MDSKADAESATARAATAAAAAEHAAYPRLSPEDVAPPPPPVVSPPVSANPYVVSAPSAQPPAKSQYHPLLLLSAAAAAPILETIHAAALTVSGCVCLLCSIAAGCVCLLGSIAAGARENLREKLDVVGRRFGDAARKTEGIVGDIWQHRELSPPPPPQIPISHPRDRIKHLFIIICSIQVSNPSLLLLICFTNAM